MYIRLKHVVVVIIIATIIESLPPCIFSSYFGAKRESGSGDCTHQGRANGKQIKMTSSGGHQLNHDRCGVRGFDCFLPPGLNRRLIPYYVLCTLHYIPTQYDSRTIGNETSQRTLPVRLSYVLHTHECAYHEYLLLS